MGLFDRFFKRVDNGPIGISSPVAGRTADISALKDRSFSSGMLGEGILIYPTEGRIHAPFDGRIDLMFASSNAFSIVSNDGIEIFIHVGCNTHELNGEGFKSLRQTDEAVRKGDLILEFDRLLLEDRGYDETVMMYVTNADEMSSLRALTDRQVAVWENVFEIRR